MAHGPKRGGVRHRHARGRRRFSKKSYGVGLRSRDLNHPSIIRALKYIYSEDPAEDCSVVAEGGDADRRDSDVESNAEEDQEALCSAEHEEEEEEENGDVEPAIADEEGSETEAGLQDAAMEEDSDGEPHKASGTSSPGDASDSEPSECAIESDSQAELDSNAEEEVEGDAASSSEQMEEKPQKKERGFPVQTYKPLQHATKVQLGSLAGSLEPIQGYTFFFEPKLAVYYANTLEGCNSLLSTHILGRREVSVVGFDTEHHRGTTQVVLVQVSTAAACVLLHVALFL
eukprot:RCo011071